MSTHTFPHRSTEDEPLSVEIEDVPTLRDLVERGKTDGIEYVKIMGRTTKGEPNQFQPTAAGHALLGDIMRRNGRALAAAEATRPAISAKALLTPKQEAYLWAQKAFGES